MGATATFLGSWTFDPLLGPVLLGAVVAYLWAAHRIDVRYPDHPWPRRHTTAFLAGIALAALVLLGPVGAYDDTFFWAHMVQHIALMMLIAPLLLLGAPVLLILRSTTPRIRHAWVLPVLRSRVVTTLCRPVIGWLVFAGVLLGTHFTPFYEFSLEHEAVHIYVEHPLYLGAALIYYYPLISANPGPLRVPHSLRSVSLFSMMFPETMTGFFIYRGRLRHVFALRPRRASVRPVAAGRPAAGRSADVGRQHDHRRDLGRARRRGVAAQRGTAGHPHRPADHERAACAAGAAMTAEPLTGPATAPVRPGRPAGVRWFSGPSLKLHATMVAGVLGCAAATWFEWTRATTGHQIAWAYVFEWPLFAVAGAARLVEAPARRRAAPPHGPPGSRREPGPAGRRPRRAGRPTCSACTRATRPAVRRRRRPADRRSVADRVVAPHRGDQRQQEARVTVPTTRAAIAPRSSISSVLGIPVVGSTDSRLSRAPSESTRCG